jgi:biotin carboxylase
VKKKSLMKETFLKAGVPVARGKVVQNITEARRLINNIGYPVVAKPDIGVGAAKTYKIHDAQELDDFFLQKPDVIHSGRKFITGKL